MLGVVEPIGFAVFTGSVASKLAHAAPHFLLLTTDISSSHVIRRLSVDKPMKLPAGEVRKPRVNCARASWHDFLIDAMHALRNPDAALDRLAGGGLLSLKKVRCRKEKPPAIAGGNDMNKVES